MAQPSASPVPPFAAKEYVDRRRACGILGVGLRTLERLAASGRVGYIDLRKKSHKRLQYQSIVDFCDRLRQESKIADRRPQLAPHLRHRDEDLLPFPLADTIHAEEACELLGFRHLQPVVRLIEEGKFEAYQLAAQAPGASRAARSMPSWKKCAAPSRTIPCATDSRPHRHTSEAIGRMTPRRRAAVSVRLDCSRDGSKLLVSRSLGSAH